MGFIPYDKIIVPINATNTYAIAFMFGIEFNNTNTTPCKRKISKVKELIFSSNELIFTTLLYRGKTTTKGNNRFCPSKVIILGCWKFQKFSAIKINVMEA